MKIYIWKNNRTNSDFTEEEGLSADHSACLVVLAETEERATEIAQAVGIFAKGVEKNKPIEISQEKEGVIVYADGDC